MNPRLSTLGPAVRRLLPVIVSLVVIAIAFLLFIQPRLADWLRAQNDARSLDQRIAAMRASIRNAGALPPAGEDALLREFESRTPAEDKVPELIELLARRALDPKAPGRLRGLLIEAGQRVTMSPLADQQDQSPRVASPPGQTQTPPVDPRLALFGGPFDYTPVSVSFLATYDRVGDFLWRCRDLPTTVEIRTFEIVRGLPLVRVRMTLNVYQRSRAPAVATTQVAG